ncbi:MAG: hypothetical protein IPP74_13550 [Alphaproteobacteria bacterium]|nr:hypothetical protein [Alphaproteobacteria bacterium]
MKVTFFLIFIFLYSFANADKTESEYSYISFTDSRGNYAGKLSWENGTLKFYGNANDSALIFFKENLKQIIDEYIKENSRCLS